MIIATIRVWLTMVFLLMSRIDREIPKPKRHRFTVIGVVSVMDTMTSDEIATFSFNVLAESADLAAERVYQKARKFGYKPMEIVNALVVPGWNKVIYSQA